MIRFNKLFKLLGHSFFTIHIYLKAKKLFFFKCVRFIKLLCKIDVKHMRKTKKVLTLNDFEPFSSPKRRFKPIFQASVQGFQLVVSCFHEKSVNSILVLESLKSYLVTKAMYYDFYRF